LTPKFDQQSSLAKIGACRVIFSKQKFHDIYIYIYYFWKEIIIPNYPKNKPVTQFLPEEDAAVEFQTSVLVTE
jgi:hypothetical protein